VLGEKHGFELGVSMKKKHLKEIEEKHRFEEGKERFANNMMDNDKMNQIVKGFEENLTKKKIKRKKSSDAKLYDGEAINDTEE
jgi:hypothetical protein